MKKFIPQLICLSLFLNSCSFFNNKSSDVKISSNPQGAIIVIEGRKMGYTPAILNLQPKRYVITLRKPDYGSAIFEIDSFASIKTSIDGSIHGDGYRCLLDSLNPILFFTVFLKNCQDFKKKVYEVNIANTQNFNTDNQKNSSIIGIGNVPQNMIYYNYNDKNK